MGLIALDNKDRICSLDFASGHEIRDKYPLGSLTCPFCGGVVSAVDREDYVLFFRHHKSECTATLEHHPESLEHLLGKKFLAERLSLGLQKTSHSKNCSVEIEYPIQGAGENGRIADVALVYSNGNILIQECQLSPITTDELEQRSCDYRLAGVPDVTWFLGPRAANQSTIDWAFAHQGFCQILDFEIVGKRQKSWKIVSKSFVLKGRRLLYSQKVEVQASEQIHSGQFVPCSTRLPISPYNPPSLEALINFRTRQTNGKMQTEERSRRG